MNEPQKSAPYILIVDDEESIRFSLRLFLENDGAQVDTAENAGKAMTLIGRHSYDVAVVDRILPDGNGLDILERLADIRPDCKGILMSAYPSFESAAETLRFNTFAYLTKPVTKDEICLVVAQAARQGEMARMADRESLLFHSLFDTSPTPVLVHALGAERIFVNHAFTDHFGYTVEDVTHMPEKGLELLNRNDQFHRDLQSLLSGRSVPERETTIITREGETRNAAVTISLCRSDSGRPTDILIVIRDITKEKSWEAQRIRTEKMEAVSAMAGGITHDLSNVMQSLSANLEIIFMMMARAGGPENISCAEMQENFTRLQTAVNSGLELLHRLRNLKSTQSRYRRSSISPVIRQAMDLARPTIPDTIALETADPLPDVEIDMLPDQLVQCLLNLIINARDAIMGNATNAKILDEKAPDAPSGSIRIHARQTPPSPNSHSRALRSRDCLQLRIIDTGPGMSDAVQARIFEPFFSTKSGDHERGLGLPMIFKTVQAHNGEIRVHSESGKGAEFEILLPTRQGAGRNG